LAAHLNKQRVVLKKIGAFCEPFSHVERVVRRRIVNDHDELVTQLMQILKKARKGRGRVPRRSVSRCDEKRKLHGAPRRRGLRTEGRAANIHYAFRGGVSAAWQRLELRGG
jgi:hypothetical protein